jgi:CTP synthase
MDDWIKMVDTVVNPKGGTVEIAVVGKYTSLRDSYKSIYEAITHGGIANDVKVHIRMIESEDIEKHSPEKYLSGVNGILIPGGFGDRGIEGKILTAKYARENKIPFFGICLGMQCAVIEFGRNVLNFKNANSSEFNPKTKYPVIDLMAEQKKVTAKGGTMRLGQYPCVIKAKTKAAAAYGSLKINERHRHRYEFNPAYKKTYEKKGMVFAGINPGTQLTEIIELADHPWFVACQFHPEFKSTPLTAHPLFRDFIKAAAKR